MSDGFSAMGLQFVLDTFASGPVEVIEIAKGRAC